MEEVGDSVLSTTLQVLFDHISLNKDFLLGLFPGNGKQVLKRLIRVLRIVIPVLQDAESKQDRSPAVRTWFDSIKHAVYQADDVLDEINTDRLRIQVQHSKVHWSDTNFSDQFIGELSPRLEEICDALERNVQQIGLLGLRILYGKQKQEDRKPSTSKVEQSQICGRDEEKEKIIQMVLSSDGVNEISVIPIVGMGGIGKTTLAQLVYNDERVKNHFETRVWVCVSDEFDVYRVTKELLMEVNPSVVEKKDDLNGLQVKLEANLEGKRFIIILDDIWNDNYNDCHNLMTPLKSGSPGSKIILTTRNENIALMLQNEPFHRLEPISDDQSWSLFKLHVSNNRARTLSPEFKTIGKTIAKKCKGLPLAIKTVAGALCSKHDIRDWHDISINDNWMAEGEILPALSLSYKLLPSHLKCCFAFCAVFPKDVPFNKEETIVLWMANDLVKPSTQKVAQNYFEELRSRSFFEVRYADEYVMHDLINDLARHVSGKFCARLEDYELKDLQRGIQGQNKLPLEVLHFSYLSSRNDTFKRFRGLAQVQGVRTFLPVHQFPKHERPTTFEFSDMLPKLLHIRALSFCECRISVIPDSIGDLKHLRFLNLAGTDIVELPNGITQCLNLQTLILAGCIELQTLPEDMRLLINLQHLDVRNVGYYLIHEIESWLSKLKDIQNLSIFVDNIYGNGIEQLDKLQVGQSLTIFKLDNAFTVEMARNAQLKNKNCIEELSLQWIWTGLHLEDELPECSEDHLNIFAELIPHTNIRELDVKWYRGTTFPNWVGDSSFCNMESLFLEGCHCFHLPPLGQLTGLKRLKISYLIGITEVGEELYGNSSICTLQYLKISNCNNLLSFSKGGVRAPNMKELKIRSCKKLKSLPEEMHTQLSSLRKMKISYCPEMECFPDGGLPPSLQKLEINDCKKVTMFPRNWVLQRLPSLIKLVIWAIEDKLFPEVGLLPASLQRLYMLDCPNLEALNRKGFQDITSLKDLYILRCPKLRYLPKVGLRSSLSKLHIESCQKLRCLRKVGIPSSLSEFFIGYCPELKYLPKDGLPSSLSKLYVIDCPKLKGRIEREKGKDWPKVSHIPIIKVDWKLI